MSISSAQSSMAALNRIYAQHNGGKKMDGDAMASYMKLTTSSSAAGKGYNRDYHAIWDQMIDGDNIKGNSISLERFYASNEKLMFQSLNSDIYSYNTKTEKLERLTEEQFVKNVSDKNPFMSDLSFGDDSYVLKSYTLSGKDSFKNIGDKKHVTERMDLLSGHGRSAFNKIVWEYGAKNNNKVDFAKIFGKESNVLLNKSSKNGKQEMLIHQGGKIFVANCDSGNPSSIKLKEASSLDVLDAGMKAKGYKATNYKIQDGWLSYDVADVSGKIISKGLICDDLSKMQVASKDISSLPGSIKTAQNSQEIVEPVSKPVPKSKPNLPAMPDPKPVDKKVEMDTTKALNILEKHFDKIETIDKSEKDGVLGFGVLVQASTDKSMPAEAREAASYFLANASILEKLDNINDSRNKSDGRITMDDIKKFKAGDAGMSSGKQDVKPGSQNGNSDSKPDDAKKSDSVKSDIEDASRKLGELDKQSSRSSINKTLLDMRSTLKDLLSKSKNKDVRDDIKDEIDDLEDILKDVHKDDPDDIIDDIEDVHKDINDIIKDVNKYNRNKSANSITKGVNEYSYDKNVNSTIKGVDKYSNNKSMSQELGHVNEELAELNKQSSRSSINQTLLDMRSNLKDLLSKSKDKDVRDDIKDEVDDLEDILDDVHKNDIDDILDDVDNVRDDIDDIIKDLR